MAVVALVHEDAAKALESVLELTDQIERLLALNPGERERKILKAMLKRTDAVREVLEDGLDGLEADQALSAERGPSVPWQDIKADYGL